MTTNGTDSGLDDIVRIQKKLDKITTSKKDEGDQAKDLLKKLRDANVTLEVLQKTRIGLTVNSLRKSISGDPDLVTLSKDLIKKWKKLIDGGPATKTSKPPTPTGKSDNKNDKSHDKHHEKNNSSSHVSIPASNTSNEVRIKCREMLSTALKTPCENLEDDCIELKDPDELASSIEDCIFREFKTTDNRYKNRIRSRYMNLKDVRNPDLRSNVLRGAITCEKLAKMEASVSLYLLLS